MALFRPPDPIVAANPSTRGGGVAERDHAFLVKAGDPVRGLAAFRAVCLLGHKSKFDYLRFSICLSRKIEPSLSVPSWCCCCQLDGHVVPCRNATMHCLRVP